MRDKTTYLSKRAHYYAYGTVCLEYTSDAHPSLGLTTSSLAHDPLSSLVYTTITHTPLVAGTLPINKIWLLDDGQQIHLCFLKA